MQTEIEKIFVNLIQTYLSLPDNYGTNAHGSVIPCVVIKAQNIKLFETPRMQITVSTISSRTFSNRREVFEETVGLETNFFEKVCMNEQRIMQIDVYSRNNEARQRFWEVQASLNSTLSQQLQDQYQFRISQISNSYNLSGLDGGSDINRYTIRFNCLSWQEKITPIEYYNTFRFTSQSENNTFADFTITEQGVTND